MKKCALLKLVLMVLLLQTAAMPSLAAHVCQSMDMTSLPSPELDKPVNSAHAEHMAVESQASPDSVSQPCECVDCTCPVGQCHANSFLTYADKTRFLAVASPDYLNQRIYGVLPQIITPDLRPPIIW
tara:strand:- start:93858 stop:94238 length:381 start_codon:yes stop_codon:yes gene_type:complete